MGSVAVAHRRSSAPTRITTDRRPRGLRPTSVASIARGSRRWRWRAAWAWALVGGAAFAQGEPPRAGSGIDVLHYTAQIEPDLAQRSLRGQVAIRFQALVAGQQQIEFDAGELQVESVRENGQALAFEKLDQRLRVKLPAPAAAGQRREIQIAYRGAPKFGLEFHPERSEVYTVFSTSQWLVCVDAPRERATLDLSLTVPDGLKAVGNGRLLVRYSGTEPLLRVMFEGRDQQEFQGWATQIVNTVKEHLG